MWLNNQHIENNSFVTKAQENHNEETYKEHLRQRWTLIKSDQDQEVYMNHLNKFIIRKDITEEQKEKEAEYWEQFIN